MARACCAAQVSAASDDHNCAVRLDGVVVCWGHADGGEEVGTIERPGGGLEFTQVTTGRQFDCAVDVHGHVMCWGSKHAAGISPLLASGEFFELSAYGDTLCAVTVGESPAAHCWSSGNANMGAPEGIVVAM